MNTESSPLPAISKRAVLLGVLADIVGSTLVGVLIGFGIGFVLGLSGNAPADIASVGKLPIVQAVLFVIGAIMTSVGGFVAAYFAGYRMRIHALWCGISVEAIGILVNALPLLVAYTSHPDTIEIGSALRTICALIVTIPAAYIGGMFAERYAQMKAAKTATA